MVPDITVLTVTAGNSATVVIAAASASEHFLLSQKDWSE